MKRLVTQIIKRLTRLSSTIGLAALGCSLLVGLPKLVLAGQANLPALSECTLIVDQACFLEYLATLYPKQSTITARETALATAIMMELLVNKTQQTKVWPYSYQHKLKSAVFDFFKISPFNDVFVQNQSLLHQNSGQNPQLKSKQASRHFSCNTQDLTFQQALFCVVLNHDITNQNQLNIDERQALLLTHYELLLASAHIGDATKVLHQLIALYALAPKSQQTQIKIAIAEQLFAVGQLPKAIEALHRIRPISNQLKLYPLWYDFLIEAQDFLEDDTVDGNQYRQLLQQPSHVSLLEELATHDVAVQVRVHRLLAMNFFYTSLNKSSSHNFVMAYHLQRWTALLDTAPQSIQRTEALHMLLLQLRIRSYFDSQLLTKK